ncbi:MAG TPA: hypothetical protein VFE62_17425 [Gemmataceae bacterium]|nr:hypothetical protein [Gemmataceae bacterium]
MARLHLFPLLAALVLWSGTGPAAFAQKGKPSKADIIQQRREPMPAKPKPAEDNVPLSPAKQKARDRVQQAERQYRSIDALIEVHENRIRTLRSIRVPAGVRPPQIDPVPTELLQRRAHAWNFLQDAIRAYKQTP